MKEKQLLMITIPGSQKKTCYNIAAKAGVKIAIHTIGAGKNACVLILIDKNLLGCNLFNLPEEAHGVYRFFDEMRKRNFEYKLDVFSHDYTETKKRNYVGVFETTQQSLF